MFAELCTEVCNRGEGVPAGAKRQGNHEDIAGAAGHALTARDTITAAITLRKVRENFETREKRVVHTLFRTSLMFLRRSNKMYFIGCTEAYDDMCM